MKKTIISVILISLILSFSYSSEKTSVDRYDYPDVLNIKNIPDSTNDWNAFFFADQGAWFGFALPDEPEYFGSFIGPFSMRIQKWLAKDLIRFNLYDASNKKINFMSCNRHSIHYFPGILKQQYDFKNLSVELSLFYVSDKEAIVKSEIKNNSNSAIKITTEWTGKLFAPQVKIKQTGNQIKLLDEKDRYQFVLFSEKHQISNSSDSNFSIKDNKTIDISPNSGVTKSIRLIYSQHGNKINLSSSSPIEQYQMNLKRWNNYLENIFLPETKWLKQDKYKRVAVKALETLVLNWRSAADDLYHDGLFPSSSVWYFNGFWAWDSWKHAVAISRFAPELAKDQIRTMFDYQNEKGMVADCIYLDKKENNWRNTKPPLAVWALWKIYQKDQDIDFIREMFPKLITYHQWWYKYRDHDSDGLCEFGSTDGSVIAAKWESGMDNAVRFDHSKILDNNGNEWSLDQESVDLNAYLYAEKIFLSKMAEMLDEPDKANRLSKDAKDLKIMVQNSMFNKTTGFFYDIDYKSNQFLETKGPEGWTPLFTGLATKKQALQVVKTICDTSEFATYIPFPTVSRKSPKFSTGYWRGTVWFDQACFGVMALREYGYHIEADKFTQQLLDRPEGLSNADMPIRENYWSLDGEGMRANNFSWSAAHILMLLWEEKF